MTAVPSVTFGPNGFQSPAAADVLVGVQADITAAFGKTLNYQLTTPQGQLSTSWAAAVVDKNALFQYYVNQVDPPYSSGRMQDAIARIYFLERLPAIPTILQVLCTGLLGTQIIETLSSIVDGSGNVYVCTQSGIIPSSGQITLPFAAQTVGPIPVPSQVSIYRAASGWDSVTVSSGTVGQNTESPAQFESRRVQSVAKNAVGILNAVLGEVLSVDGVIDAYVTENFETSPQTIGGYTLSANSIYVAVVGGDHNDVASAIWRKRAPGCAFNGNVVVTVTDANAGYSPPLPTYQIRFEEPTPLPILFSVTLTSNPQVPADAVDQVRAAILAAFNGEDGGARARIGSTIYASRYVTPIVLLGSWAQLQSIFTGSPNVPAAVFTGSIAADVLTVSFLTSGTVAVGHTIIGSNDDVAVNTTIVSQLSGTPGGIGTYEVSASQTVSSEGMKTVAVTAAKVDVQIDQTPELSSDNIAVVLT